jgi:SAM-dependent methyltransferase
MKISEIAAYRELLESMRPHQSRRSVSAELDPLIDTIERHSNQMPRYLAELQYHRAEVLSSLQQFDVVLDGLLAALLDQITALEPSYLARSYQLYEDGMTHDSVDHVLNRRFPITAVTQDYIASRVQAHSDFHHAGLLIRPGLETWVEQMVACDPLYIVDTSHDLFQPVKARFNPLYQSRLRYYAIRESSDVEMMGMLPHGQFGFCLAYNFFHYKPFEIMRAYLREIYQKLKPGGVLGLTFNDCDRRGAVELAERMMNCYTPGRLVLSACESAGFVIEQNYRIDAAVNWLELRKPGHKPSLRAGQTLAKIVAKSK